MAALRVTKDDPKILGDRNGVRKLVSVEKENRLEKLNKLDSQACPSKNKKIMERLVIIIVFCTLVYTLK